MLLLLSLAAVSAAQAGSLDILSQNMRRLYDDVDDGNREPVLTAAAFAARVDAAAIRFADDFGPPHIIALQEVENLNVLRRIAARMRQRHGVAYQARLLAEHGRATINLGYLVREDVAIRRVEQLFRDHALPFDASPLFSRPPLLLEACHRARCITVVNLHLRSMRGIDSRDRGDRVARKRRRQAETIASWAHRFQRQNTPAALMLLGDFNALTPADRYVDVAGILRGSPDNSAVRLPSRDRIEPDLVDLTRAIPGERRYSYIFRGRRQQLDYMLVSPDLGNALRDIAYARIDYAFSDHAALRARLDW